MTHTLEDRLAAQRRLRGASWFADLAPTTGRDPHSGLEVEADVSGWPLRVVRLDSVSEALRDPDGLLAALRRALGVAALAHLAAVAVRRDLTPEQLARAEELVSGQRRIVPRPAYRALPVLPPHGPLDPVRVRVDERWDRAGVGRSREGEVEVELDWVGGLRALRCAPGFLPTTSASMLRYALSEAFSQAQRPQEGTRP